ncbi:MAG: 16S rRNA (uracil(1498)-N(3))-methyltransferase [Lachnospiraceae bacterium]|nr:16S rRNA (uracil(1498)-N(3))-methyltransferase [Lachnospiraceae bacterium]
MYHFFVEPSQIDVERRRVVITGEDVNHIVNVLRIRQGEELAVSNGVDGKEYRCEVHAFDGEQVECVLRFIKEDGVELPARVRLFQALPKADKMELIIQKAVELGVYEIIPVASGRCVVKLDAKKEVSKLARWNAISEAAAKQSRRALIPKVSPVVSFADAVKEAAGADVKMIPYELAADMERTRALIGSIRPGTQIAVMIGPEGGFEETEIELAKVAGIVPVTLGRRILRTETAGFTVMAWLMYHLETT